MISALLIAATAVFWALGFVFFGRAPRIGGVAPGAPVLPSVSIIVPTLNEEHNLRALLDSIAVQTVRPHEILVADDGSADRTADVAVGGGARVVNVGPKPEGFQGKTWPCYCGAQAATGDLLLFLDADVRLVGPEALARLLGEAVATQGIVSVEPYHAVLRPYEELSAVCNVIRTASVGAFGLFGPGRVHGAFGPCLLLSRALYFATGGHANPAVRGQILENFVLGLLLTAEGRQVRCLAGRDAVAFRMYPQGLRELVDGWSKAFSTGAGRTPRATLLLAVLWLAGAIQSVLLLATVSRSDSFAVLACAAGLWIAYAVQLHLMFSRLGSFGWLTAILYPIPVSAFLVIFLRSALLAGLYGRVVWRGQEVAVAHKPKAP